MSQASISKLLTERYPEYLSVVDIVEITGLSKSSVCSNLKKLLKREEIEYELRMGKKQASHFTRSYRLKPD